MRSDSNVTCVARVFLLDLDDPGVRDRVVSFARAKRRADELEWASRRYGYVVQFTDVFDRQIDGAVDAVDAEAFVAYVRSEVIPHFPIHAAVLGSGWRSRRV